MKSKECYMQINDTGLVKALQNRVLGEWDSISIYSQLADWCKLNGYEGGYNWFNFYVQEETMHRNKVSGYLCDNGIMPTVPMINSSGLVINNLEDCINIWVTAMEDATMQILEVVRVARKVDSECTVNFMQFFVQDQAEGEALAINTLDYCTNIGLFSDAPDWAKGMMRAELDEKLMDIYESKSNVDA